MARPGQDKVILCHYKRRAGGLLFSSVAGGLGELSRAAWHGHRREGRTEVLPVAVLDCERVNIFRVGLCGAAL